MQIESFSVLALDLVPYGNVLRLPITRVRVLADACFLRSPVARRAVRLRSQMHDFGHSYCLAESLPYPNTLQSVPFRWDLFGIGIA